MRRNKVPRPAGKTSSKRGLGIGRYNDRLITNYYPKPGKLRKKVKPKDRRALRTIEHLEDVLGLTDIISQYPVVLDLEGHKVKTHVDLIGFKDNVIVVIELKNTQHLLETHKQLYHLNCGATRLANYLSDTEHTHHQLQAALGVLGTRRRVNTNHKVVGRVVVSAEDHVISYGCDDVFIRKSHFAVVPVTQSFKKAEIDAKITLMEMPEDDDDQKYILETIWSSPLKHFKEVVRNAKPNVSFVLRKQGTEEYAFIGILNDPSGTVKNTKKYSRTRSHLLSEAAAFKGSVIPVRCGILTFTNQQYTLHTLRN
jgi:hypothetical protein